MEFKINNQIWSVEIIRKKIKHLYIRIKNNNIISITCSPKYSDKIIADYLKQNEMSVNRLIKNHRQRQVTDAQPYYLGTPYQVVYNKSLSKVFIENNYIYAPDSKALEVWLDQSLKLIATERFNHWTSIINSSLAKTTLKFRKMTSRWGVCNRNRNIITLNTKLIRYNEAVIDYVIIHELCHFQHPHHQQTFWEAVETYCPNYNQLRKILKE